MARKQPEGLGDFEGLPVRQAGIEIPGAAGGLRESMKIAPETFRKGDRVFVALECVVGKVRFDPIDKEDLTGDQRRVHVFEVEAATIVDESVVRAELDAQAERIKARQDEIKKAEEEAAGIARLPTDEAE